jgi:hypothetical protein
MTTGFLSAAVIVALSLPRSHTPRPSVRGMARGQGR